MSVPYLDWNLQNWIQALSWIATVLFGVFAVVKGLRELSLNRAQRADELQWKRAEAAKTLNDKMLESSTARAARHVLDCDGGLKMDISFDPAKPNIVKITQNAILEALAVRPKNGFPALSDEQAFIRNAFDNFFYHMGVFEHYIDRNLIDFGDVKHPIDYYVGHMSAGKDIFDKYVRDYGFWRTTKFLNRF